MMLTIVSWNVNGLRSAVTKGFASWLEETKPDIVCLQETRATFEQLKPLESLFMGYQAVWHPALRPGYAGTAILTRYQPASIEYGLNGEADPEGRSLTIAFDGFYVASFYAPNAPPETPKIKVKQDWIEALGRQIASHADAPFIAAGDFNVARTRMDSRGLPHPNNGCTDEERTAFQTMMDTCRLCDPMREQAGKDVILSTWWHAREQERRGENGVRFDYILLRSEDHPLVCGSVIHAEVRGSDHCPISLTVDLPEERLTPVREIIGQTSLL